MPLWSRLAAGCILGAALASAGGAQPLPQPRPPDEPSSTVQPGPPLPRARPARPATGSSPAGSDRTDDGTASAESSPPAADFPPPPVDAGQEFACRQRLVELGVAFEEIEPIDGSGACGAAAPVRVHGLGGGIDLTPPATLNCRTAEALARWTQDVVAPAAERHLDAEPTDLVNASSYVCRSRNNRPGARLSEHATANAIDIGGIAFAQGEPVPILARNADEAGKRTFQRAIRRGACEHFTTVIGPGTNAAHATHFHFDLAERRGGYRLCE